MTTAFDREPGLWLRRLRLGAEVLVAVGGAVLTVVTAYEELADLAADRRSLLDHGGQRQRERDDG